MNGGFDNVDDSSQYVKRMGEALGTQQREIVGRAVILGIFAIGRTYQATDRQIETGRAILPLIVPIRNEGVYPVGERIMR